MTSRKLLRYGLAIGLAITLASACGSDDSANDQASTTEVADATSAGDTAADEVESDEADTDEADTDEPEPEASDEGDDSATRTVESVNGPVEVPIEAQRVFALDEYAGAALLYSGVEPVAVFAPFRARIPLTILQDGGVDVTEVVFGEWNVEQIAILEPDLILMTDLGDPTIVETLGGIAPTVVLPFVAPWPDIVAAVGAASGRPEIAAAVTEELTSRLSELESESSDETISVLATGPQFGTFTIGVGAVGSSILEQSGYLRPEAQLEPPDLGASLSLSPENLEAHGADHVLQLGGDESFYSVEELQALPTFQAIPSIQDGRTSVGLGEIWTSSDPFSAFWMIEDLRAIATGDAPGTIDDVGDRWSDFLSVAGQGS